MHGGTAGGQDGDLRPFGVSSLSLVRAAPISAVPTRFAHCEVLVLRLCPRAWSSAPPEVHGQAPAFIRARGLPSSARRCTICRRQSVGEQKTNQALLDQAIEALTGRLLPLVRARATGDLGSASGTCRDGWAKPASGNTSSLMLREQSRASRPIDDAVPPYPHDGESIGVIAPNLMRSSTDGVRGVHGWRSGGWNLLAHPYLPRAEHWQQPSRVRSYMGLLQGGSGMSDTPQPLLAHL